MVEMKYVEKGNTITVIVSIIIGGLGFYLALALTNAINVTINTLLPDFDSEITGAWIALGIALLLVSLIVIIIIMFYNR
jgi:hypothetical protein